MIDIAQLRFLVVEDHGFQRWLIANLLEEVGARSVVTAADGEAALHLLTSQGEAIDVVVTDLDMPGMDGMELIRHIAKSKLSAGLILVSSLDRSVMATVETMAGAYRAKVLGAVQKPLTAKKLLAALGTIDEAHATASRKPAPRHSFTAAEIAWALRHGQFETHYQPKVELATEQIRGAEALTRWRHPDLGLLGPAAFMTVIETDGLADELTRYVVANAARNCVEWRNAGLGMNVSVNLSVASLSDVTLAERMTRLVAECSLDPRHLTFEITESATTREVGTKLENLARLRMRGFGLSIDDFGTGFSSMERLARIPFTELKIDQSFVRNAATQPSSRAMVESSLELAQKLGIQAAAEGVESQAEWALLMELGCKLAQGYYISEPLEPGEFQRWARRYARVTPISRC